MGMEHMYIDTEGWDPDNGAWVVFRAVGEQFTQIPFNPRVSQLVMITRSPPDLPMPTLHRSGWMPDSMVARVLDVGYHGHKEGSEDNERGASALATLRMAATPNALREALVSRKSKVRDAIDLHSRIIEADRYLDELIIIHERSNCELAHAHIARVVKVMYRNEGDPTMEYVEDFLPVVKRVTQYAKRCGWASVKGMNRALRMVERGDMYGEDHHVGDDGYYSHRRSYNMRRKWYWSA